MATRQVDDAVTHFYDALDAARAVRREWGYHSRASDVVDLSGTEVVTALLAAGWCVGLAKEY